MAKRVRYFYDEESCTFREEQKNFGGIAKEVLTYVLVSTFIAAMAFSAYFYAYDDPKDAILKQENATLKQQIKQLEKKFAGLESTVDALHDRDSEFYRSIMNTDPISTGIWNGGKGGAAAIEQISNTEVAKEAERRLSRIKHKVELQSKSYDLLFSLLSAKEDELRHIPAIKPVPGRIISGYGMRHHPILKIRRMHAGLDLEAKTGTEVRATGDARVKFVGVRSNGYGRHIVLDHGGFGYETLYAHLSETLVKRGQRVKRGDVIGLSGNTGLSNGPHLHYEIFKNGKKINPIDYFYGDQSPEEYAKLREQAKVENMSMD